MATSQTDDTGYRWAWFEPPQGAVLTHDSEEGQEGSGWDEAIQRAQGLLLDLINTDPLLVDGREFWFFTPREEVGMGFDQDAVLDGLSKDVRIAELQEENARLRAALTQIAGELDEGPSYMNGLASRALGKIA